MTKEASKNSAADFVNNGYAEYYIDLKNILYELFANRKDVYARAHLNGKRMAYSPIHGEITPDIIQQHIEGGQTLGLYQLDKKNNVKWGVCDFDENTLEDFEKAKKLYCFLQAKGYNPLMENSGGGDYKVHIWIFSDTDAVSMREFLKEICKEASIIPHEIFPKQNEINSDGLGNLVKLPLALHLASGKRSFFYNDKFEMEEDFLTSLQKHLENRDSVPKIKVIQKEVYTNSNKDNPHDCPFLNYCLSHELPLGKRHEVISKNMSAYIKANSEGEKIKKAYIDMQKGVSSEVEGWLKKDIQLSCGELINYQREFKIPSKCKGCPRFAEYKEEKKTEKNIKQINKQITAIEQFREISEDEEKQNNELKLIMLSAIVLKSKDLQQFNEALEEFVRVIKQRIKVYTWKDDNCPELWVYDSGIYTSNGESKVQKEIRNILGECYDENIAKKIIARLKIDTQINPEDFIERALKHKFEICVNNGIIKINPVNYEITLENHDSGNIFLNKIPVDYEVKAECPIIDKFLADTLADASDINTFYEAVGTGLDTSLTTKKSVIAYGVPDTGKTTSTNLIHAFYGSKNCANLTLQQITEDRYSVSQLFGKIACIAGDLSQETLKNIDIFKRLTGGDPFEGDRKYRTHLIFNNQAKFFFNLNILPRVYNADDAFWNRLITFKFTRTFCEKSVYDSKSDDEKKESGIKDPSILAKMTSPEEMSGLLNKALQGLIRYYQNGKFSYSKGTAQVKDEWIRLSDSFMAFCLDELEPGEYNDFVTRRALTTHYHKFCKKHKVQSLGDKALKATLSSHFGVYTETDAKREVPAKSGNYERVWEGIKWKKQC